MDTVCQGPRNTEGEVEREGLGDDMGAVVQGEYQDEFKEGVSRGGGGVFFAVAPMLMDTQ